MFVIKLVEKTGNFSIDFSLTRCPKVSWPTKREIAFKSIQLLNTIISLFCLNAIISLLCLNTFISPFCLNFSDKTWLFLSLRIIRTIVFILIVILTTFRPMYPSALFRCFMSGALTQLRTDPFI